MNSNWQQAQKLEAGFWGDCRDTFNEEAKQLVMAKAMGLDADYGLNYARALLVPTYYIGPFEGVNVEAQLSGCPVITTDWGCFAETVEDGSTGFRCRTMAEFLRAVERTDGLDRSYIQARAINNYSLERGKELYQQYFENLMDVSRGDGFYQERDLGDYIARGVI